MKKFEKLTKWKREVQRKPQVEEYAIKKQAKHWCTNTLHNSNHFNNIGTYKRMDP